ncbi:uncharacterized protein LOC118435299 [Folsomia candida]|uniref:Uncharacterized protein n=1 Tax=Folsomia candida TaxID=158441 RepID=A0A226EF64_FOLCA|nr:uncharacterized protein LOC118435299 [Folsomia candida]OXA55727.1 hypothetical protein Fcan01_09071 [Folsomia candida]
MGTINLLIVLLSLLITLSQQNNQAEFDQDSLLQPINENVTSSNNLTENSTNSANHVTNNDTTTTYILQGIAPQYEVFHSTKYANLTGLKDLILLEYVTIEADDFLAFLQLHFATLESITLQKVTVEGTFLNKTKVYLPKLKSFYANIDHKQGQTYQDLFSIMFFTTNNATTSWEREDVWLQRVNLVVIVDDEIYFEIDHDAGILKSRESKILQSVDTPLTTIALTSTSGDKLGPVKYQEQVQNLVLNSLIDAARNIDDWIKQFTNLKSLAYSPSPFGPTDPTLFPVSLKNLTLQFTSLIPRGPISSVPVALDHLNLDCEVDRIKVGLDRLYNAKRVSIKSYFASVPLLKSIMRMGDVQWIYYEYTKVDWLQDGVSEDVQGFLEDLGIKRKNFTSFILDKDSNSKIWTGRYVDSAAEKLQIKKNLFNIEPHFDAIGTKLSRDTDQLISNCTIDTSGKSLLLGGRLAKYAKPNYSLVGLKSIFFLPYVSLESDKFLHFLESNQQTLESIQLINVTRSGKFNQTISLPKLKQLIVHGEVLVRDADYQRWRREDNILSSIIAFITTKNTSSPKNTSFESIAAEDVDVSFVENDIQLFHINHTNGILKSRIFWDYGSTKINEKVLYAATRQNSTWLRSVALSNGEISDPPPETFNPANVTRLILHWVDFSNFTTFIQKFSALQTLILQQSRGYRAFHNFTLLPNSLEKLTLQDAQIEIPTNPTNNPVELLELNLVECRYPYSTDAKIDGIYNAKNITLVSRYPPTELLESSTSMTKAEWIFVLFSNANVIYLDAWKNLIEKFGLMGSELCFILEKVNGTWVGRKVEESINNPIIQDLMLKRLRVDYIFNGKVVSEFWY